MGANQSSDTVTGVEFLSMLPGESENEDGHVRQYAGLTNRGIKYWAKRINFDKSNPLCQVAGQYCDKVQGCQIPRRRRLSYRNE